MVLSYNNSTSRTIYIAQDIVVTETVQIEDGAILRFCGGRIVNNTGSTIIIEGYNISIIAGIEQIFVGDFEFRSSKTYTVTVGGEDITYHYPVDWNIECAYPQWFGARSCADKLGSSSLIDGEEDASVAINAAIRLKRVGKVKIPAGIYKITRFINVPPGIILEGETPRFSHDKEYGTVLFPWHDNTNESQIFPRGEGNTNAGTVTAPVSSMDFPPHPDDVNWHNDSFSHYSGYMMLVGIADTCSLTFEAGKLYPKSITYATDTARQPQVVGTEIKNIAFTSYYNDATREHRYMRAILMSGAVKLSQVRAYSLSQLCCSVSFSDERYVERCSFAPPAFTQGTEGSPYNWGEYPQKIYAIDLEGGGDAMNIIGNHVSTYSEKIGALKVRSCNGGSITGNILNSDVLIELCRGIDFAANHMEYGATLTVATSAVSLRDNYIWRGTRPAITLRRFEGDAYNLSHWSAELSNNQLFWRSQHTPGEPQAAQSVYEFDIRTDGYGTLDIHNTFHTSSRLGPAEGSYFGLKMERMEMHRYAVEDGHATEVGFSEETATKEPFEEFNRISHIASASSHIEGYNVTPMPATITAADFSFGRDCNLNDPMAFRIARHSVQEKDQWKRPDGVPEGCSYMYTAWLFADFKRKLFIPNPYPIAGQVHPSIVPAPSTYQNQSQATLPDAALQDEKYYNLRLHLGRGELSNYDIPAGPYWMYIERSIWLPSSVQARQSVLIPVTSSCIFWDDGEYLSGYKWTAIQAGTSRADEMEAADNLRPLQVTYHGRNVVCLLPAAPQFDSHQQLVVNGEWLNGDVIEWTSLIDGTLIQYYYHNGLWYRK